MGHIASNLVRYDNLVADTQAVLTTLVAKEVEVQTSKGPGTMRIQPYRTLDNVIEGAVITFVDITEKVLALELLRKTCSQDLQSTVMQDSRDAMAIISRRTHSGLESGSRKDLRLEEGRGNEHELSPADP